MSDLQTEGTKQAMTKQTNKLQLRDSEITRYNISVEQSKEISAMYRKLAKELDKKIESIDPDKNVSSAIKQNYFNQLKKDLMSEIKDISSKTGTIIEDNMRKTSESVVKDNVSFLNKVGLKIEGAYSNVPTDVVSNIASGKVYEGNWSLSKALWKDIKIKQREINTIIAEGVALNKSTYDIAKDLEMYVDPNAKKPWDWNKVYPGVSKKIDYNSQRLARTLVSHAYQQSLVQTTKPNPFVTGLQWRSTNVRSCEICMERDGVIYPKNALPLDHPNGMCTFLPIIPDKMEDIADRIGNWYNGEPDPELDEFAKVLGYKEPEAKVVEPTIKTYKEYLPENSQDASDDIFQKMYSSIDGFSKEQIKAVKDYCGDSYKAMNSYLRKGKIEKGGSSLTPSQIKSEIKTLQDMFNSSKLPENITTFRGVSRDAIGKFEKGKIISDKAFLSTSINKDIALGFTKYSKNGVVLRIEIDEGFNVLPATSINRFGNRSMYLDEAEILFNSGAKFEMLEERQVTLDRDVLGNWGNVLYSKGDTYTEIILRVVK